MMNQYFPRVDHPTFRYNELCGRRFSRLLVIGFSHISVTKNAIFECLCDCGNRKLVQGSKMTCGRVRSCGCLIKEKGREANLTHGKTDTRIYYIWNHVIRRCSSPTDVNYANYGGRGINVCDKWKRFEGFFADMGDCPEGLTLDRIDNNKGYEPGNCRWATYHQQAINKRGVKFSKEDIEDIRASHKEFTFKELAQIFDVHYQTISDIVRGKTYRF